MNTPTRSDARTPSLEPMLKIDDIAAALACDRRTIERMRSAGKFPKPDVQLGRTPRWQRSTLVRWIAGGGK